MSKRVKKRITLLLAIFCLLFLLEMLLIPILARKLKDTNNFISPLAEAVDAKEATTVITPTQLKNIKAEESIYLIFGEEAKLALAVAKGECQGLKPDCRNVTVREHSVCFFQVNIKAHYNKIPGKNYEEKETWLSDPMNCSIMSKIIKDASKSWSPWTSFTSGAYKKFL